MSIRRRALAPLVAIVVLAVPGVARAQFSAAATASQAVSTGRLSAPADVWVSRSCLSYLDPIMVLAWTPSVDGYASGYVVTVRQSGTTTTTDVPGVGVAALTLTNIAWFAPVTFTVSTRYAQWTSPPAAVSAQCPG